MLQGESSALRRCQSVVLPEAPAPTKEVITWVRVVFQRGELLYGLTMLEHALSSAIVALAPTAEHLLHVRVVVRRPRLLHAPVQFSNCSSSAVRQLQCSSAIASAAQQVRQASKRQATSVGTQHGRSQHRGRGGE